MKLIDNWRRAHKLFTVQLGAAFVAWGSLSAADQAAILDFVHVPQHRVPAVLGILVIVGRLVAQAAAGQPEDP